MPELSVNLESPKLSEKPKVKDKLSDEQVGNMLSSIGNHEGKAITLLVMKNGDIFDSKDLHEGILRAQGENVVWRMNTFVPFNYCIKSLEPIGLVAKETIDETLKTWGYAITDYGKKFGIPWAGKLLEFSEKHNIPLSKLFGGTVSPSLAKNIQAEGEDIEYRKRAPMTALKIIFELLTHPSLPIREIDIENAIGESHINDHLNRLSEIGLIQYESIKRNIPFAFYKLSNFIPEGDLPVWKHQKTLSELVFSVIIKNPSRHFTREDVYNLFPQEQRDKYKDKNRILITISSILSHLEKNKYLQREKFDSRKQSEIDITEDQRMILSELLEIIDKLQNKDPQTLKEGRQFAERFIIDPERVSGSLHRAKEASSQANQSPIEETQKDVLSLITSNPQGLTNRQIQILLEDNFGKKKGINHVSGITSSLEERYLRVERKGTVKTFFPNTNLQAQ